MYPKKRVIADADQSLLHWSAVLLRFFQMFIGDQTAAEALTIETVAEHSRQRSPSGDEIEVSLLRKALTKALRTSILATEVSDPVIKALIRLEPSKRAAIVLWRGLSLDFETAGQVLGLDKNRVRNLCNQGLEELRMHLAAWPESPSEFGGTK